MRICFYTFGCKTNQAETSQMKSEVTQLGYEPVTQENLADVFVVNSCTVTKEADRQCRQFVRHIIRKYPSAKIILTGCYVERDKNELIKLFPEITVFGNENKLNLKKYFQNIKTRISKPEKKDDNVYVRSFVKIQDGCNAFCSYCIVPYVRPKLISTGIEQILHDIDEKVMCGAKEIVFTGIRLGRFTGKDAQGNSYNLSKLLEKVSANKKIERIRISSIEVTEITDSLLKIMADSDGKICHHLHVPLQSGSNKILQLMNRKYNTSKFEEMVARIRKYLPDCGITTDVIVGFSGETESDFEDTYNFIKRAEFSRLHVFRFSSRPGTKADLLENRVYPEEKKLRTEILQKLDVELRKQFALKYLNKIMPVLLESKNDDETVSGYTDSYIRVRIKSKKENQIVPVKIVKIDGNTMWGEIFKKNN